ncbi:conjugated polyketone reductase C1 [Rhodotorula diobovata]|uniref:Conjugated polyketone reductase C1 n=1 Tax=Rhodotorula diobovata TaxID=5288 RepID=A0A5C5FUC0_9BASI|nr:conjugated polyketone reductase C1 [Rhodotorula diobovata]
MPVPSIKLNDSTSIPLIAWGNGTGDAKKTAYESGQVAVKAGIRHIDTAQGYDNEKEAGESLVKAEKDNGIAPNSVYLTTKISTEGGDPNAKGVALEDLRQNVLDSIERLGRQPNLILIHNPFVPPKGKLVEFWRILEEMKDKGELTASLGVSNFRPQDFNELLPHCKVKPAVNQIEWHPYVLTHLQPVLDIMAEHNIVVESYGPLSPLLRHPTGGPIKPVLERIAARLSKETGKDVDAAMALLLWTRAKGVVAVTASGNSDRIHKLALTQELPDLTAEEVSEIEQLGRKIHFRAYDEHMCVDFPAPSLPKDL